MYAFATRQGRNGKATKASSMSVLKAMACDVVTLHTPLTREGEHATVHMFGQERLCSLTEDQLLINTSRGEVIDTSALLARLEAPNAPTVVLDVLDRKSVV